VASTITQERPDTPDAHALIAELEAHLEPLYPRTSRHGYSVDKLIREGVAFFVIRQDGTPAGCGGIQLVGTDYGELKRMYVRPQFRRLGLAKQMLAHLANYAQEQNVHLLRLETGIHQTDAIALYEAAGFRSIPPFGHYQADPLSKFYEKRILPKATEPGEEKALSDIAEYGCHVIHVLGEDESPPFSYSVGIEHTSGAPELLVIGLKHELAHSILNSYNARVRSGELFSPGQLYHGFVGGFDCHIRVVHESQYKEHLGYCRWLYRGNNFRALQLIYPTTQGIWPWDSAASEWFRVRQPILDQPINPSLQNE
jgi:putative acetyltransferase